MAVVCSVEHQHYPGKAAGCQIVRDPKLYPLTFIPALRDYVWGGRRLETMYNRTLPPGVVAESWEISGHPAAPTFADAGFWEGVPLPAILDALGQELAGTSAGWALERNRFPLLVKLLDAQEDLSLQVHPDDEYARIHENGELGKAEVWYFLNVDPGTRLILGLRPEVTRETFCEGLRSGRLAELLNYVPIRPGQAVPVPTGTVHALLAGTVATEIQQNSDLTYRVYDWGRVGADGIPRPLHIEKALEVIHFGSPLRGAATPHLIQQSGRLRRFEMARNPYFVTEKVELAPGASYRGACDGTTLEIWGCVCGHARIEWDGAPVHLPAIRYVLIPAALGPFRVTASEASECLRVYLRPQGAESRTVRLSSLRT
jgi:mannose-6-phosphate isomerase